MNSILTSLEYAIVPGSLTLGLLIGSLLPQLARRITTACNLCVACLLLVIIAYVFVFSARQLPPFAASFPLWALVGMAAGLSTAFFLRGPRLPR